MVGRTSAWFRHRPVQRRVLWEPYLAALIDAADGLGPARAAYWNQVPRVGAAEMREDVAIRRALALGRVADAWRSRSSSAKGRAGRLAATVRRHLP